VYIAHSQWRVVSGRQSVYSTQSVARCLWKIHIIVCVSPLNMVQFRNIANITKQLPDRFPPTWKTTNTELTNHQFRIQRNCVIAV